MTVLGKMLLPKAGWLYEGQVFVGERIIDEEWGYVENYGYANDVYLSFGSISPSVIPTLPGFNTYATRIYWEFYDDFYYPETKLFVQGVGNNTMVKAANAVEINGVVFDTFDSNGIIILPTNPFTATGTYCPVKLK